MIIRPTYLFKYLPLIGMAACSDIHTPEPPPNFVIVLFDDLGWDDLGFHGNRIIETPNLDAFAAQSARYSDFYVNPVCAASRASLLTGRFFLKTGVSHVHGGKDFMSADETTIAQVLQQNGYATDMWGKWHNGTGERYDPWQRGFDEAFAARLYKHRNAEGLLNGQPVFTEKWADELIVDYTIDFMERNRHNPFFGFVSLLSPHTPLVAPEAVVQKYLDKGLSKNLAIYDGDVRSQNQRLIYNYANKGWPPSLLPYDTDGTYEEYRPVEKSRQNPLTQVISVRAGRYKLLQYPGVDGNFIHPDSLVLINLQADPKETMRIMVKPNANGHTIGELTGIVMIPE